MQEVERATVWTTEREPPEQLLAHMLPYQKEGLGWLCAQEEGKVRSRIPYPSALQAAAVCMRLRPYA